MYLALETLDYLKKGGRISGAQAAIGTLLSVKPIIAVMDGEVETVDKVRTRSKARERLIELITERPIERLAILHTVSPDVEAFRDEILARMPGLDAAGVTIGLVGASVGPHVGPGCVGAAILYRAAILARRTLPHGCDDIADRYHSAGVKTATLAILRSQMKSRASQPRSNDPAARPVESSGRRPEPTAVTSPPEHVRTTIP